MVSQTARHAHRLVVDVVDDRIVDREGRVAVVDAVVADVGEDDAGGASGWSRRRRCGCSRRRSAGGVGRPADARPPGVLDQQRVAARRNSAPMPMRETAGPAQRVGAVPGVWNIMPVLSAKTSVLGEQLCVLLKLKIGGRGWP